MIFKLSCYRGGQSQVNCKCNPGLIFLSINSFILHYMTSLYACIRMALGVVRPYNVFSVWIFLKKLCYIAYEYFMNSQNNVMPLHSVQYNEKSLISIGNYFTQKS